MVHVNFTHPEDGFGPYYYSSSSSDSFSSLDDEPYDYSDIESDSDSDSDSDSSSSLDSLSDSDSSSDEEVYGHRRRWGPPSLVPLDHVVEDEEIRRWLYAAGSMGR